MNGLREAGETAGSGWPLFQHQPIGCMAVSQQIELLGLEIQELTALVQEAGEPDYRARQLFEAVYHQRVAQ